MQKCKINDKKDTIPEYRFLRKRSNLNGGKINWNFSKFILDQHGQVVKYVTHNWHLDEYITDI